MLELTVNERGAQKKRLCTCIRYEWLVESRIAMTVPPDELLAVNEAIAALALEDPQAAEVVQMRFFVGLTVPEIADVLDLAPRTMDRYWAFARAWLKRTIRSSLAGSAGPA
jgi:DNA-directed RNA polymerase specialized sigma24 family protein